VPHSSQFFVKFHDMLFRDEWAAKPQPTPNKAPACPILSPFLGESAELASPNRPSTPNCTNCQQTKGGYRSPLCVWPKLTEATMAGIAIIAT